MSFKLIANFKSNKTSTEVASWLNKVSPVAEQFQNQIEIILSPSSIHLDIAHTTISHLASTISLASQDVSQFPSGAYTGAVNSNQLTEFNVKFSLIGHSERRRFFHETAQEIANKAEELIKAGITPAICLAEDEIVSQFSSLDDSLIDKCLYCYEPPNDIGGTTLPPLEKIEQVASLIRAHTTSQILYGGSVTSANIKSLKNLNLAGALVSSASLSEDNFVELIKNFAL